MAKWKTFFLMLLVVATWGCKKSGSTDTSTTDPAAVIILKSKTWKPAAVDKTPSLKPAGPSTYYPIQSCRLDDIFTFGDNNVLTINSGADRCNGSQPPTEVNSYSYNQAANQISFDGFAFNVLEITPDQIKVYTQESTGATIFLFQ
jgi:hypothetical protein